MASNIEIYDPLQRPIPSDDENQALSRDKLLQNMSRLAWIQGNSLEAPLNVNNYKTLETAIDREMLICVKKAEELLKRAKLEGDIEIKSVQEIMEV